MDHTPFILGAYGAAVVIMTWCAVAPITRGRALVRALKARQTTEGKQHASQT
jgi:heme exporter protein CcmD